jgi:hypothetical protein
LVEALGGCTMSDARAPLASARQIRSQVQKMCVVGGLKNSANIFRSPRSERRDQFAPIQCCPQGRTSSSGRSDGVKDTSRRVRAARRETAAGLERSQGHSSRTMSPQRRLCRRGNGLDIERDITEQPRHWFPGVRTRIRPQTNGSPLWRSDCATSRPSPIKRQRPLGLGRNPRTSAPLSTRRRWAVTGPRPCVFSEGLSVGLSRRRSTMAPLDSQPAETILQTENSHRSTTSDEKCHPRPHHRSAT